jgi:[ribosomal protein S5]-alanine N-acetyltransferase
MIYEPDILSTKRLVIEPLSSQHADEMFFLLQDEEMYQFIPTLMPVSVEKLRERYQKLESRYAPNGDELWLNWVVKEKISGHLMGRIEATVYTNYTFDFAYLFASKYWGQGFAFESCKAVLDYIIFQYNIKKVVANVDTRNINSIKLLKKLGFEIVSNIKNADFFNGANSDEFVLELDL